MTRIACILKSKTPLKSYQSQEISGTIFIRFLRDFNSKKNLRIKMIKMNSSSCENKDLRKKKRIEELAKNIDIKNKKRCTHRCQQ